MVRRCLFLPLASLVLGCGGGVGGLLATVPPPVEFAMQRVSGLAELPTAGTYRGTLSVTRATYRYNAIAGSEGQRDWSLVKSVDLAGSGAAEATVGADGAISLRREGESAALFTGTLRVSDVQGDERPTTATLVARDGTSALYPYILRNGDPRTLTLKPHGKVTGGGTTLVSFDQYWFELSPE